LLDKSLEHSFTLVSAAAGFGKTTLLSSWARSLPTNDPLIAWISLDEEDNDPRLFWTYVLTALDTHRPELFTPLLEFLWSSQAPSLKAVLTNMINLLVECTDQFVLILDDYQMITEQEVHMTLAYLLEHLPSQLHIILATRADPPLPLAALRTGGRALEVRTDQLRCTVDETGAFFEKMVGIGMPDQAVQEVTMRTEGWLVGLQLLALSLPGYADPLPLLEEASGDHRYILDYLTEEVLRRQPQEVQTFLLCTSILDQLSTSLCDAVLKQTGSQQILCRLEQANLFVTSLDHRRQWYRYHMLFAEALRTQLEQTHSNLVPILHARASRWYAQQHQATQAILHAFKAREWQWAVDLIEREHIPVISLTWGVGKHALVLLRQWLEQLPVGVMAGRPRFCLTCTQMLWTATSQSVLYTLLDAAEVTLTASLKAADTSEDASHTNLALQTRQEQMNLLGEVFALRAYLRSYTEDGQAALALCEQAQAFLSAENYTVHALVALSRLISYYTSSANNAMAAIERGYQATLFAQMAKQPALTIKTMEVTAITLIAAGRLHEAKQLTQQAMQLGTQSAVSRLPETGWAGIWLADVLCEWNEVDAARSLVGEAISLCEQAVSYGSLFYFFCGHAILARICLSCGELDAAYSALQQAERIGRNMNQQLYRHLRSLYVMVSQVRLWLARGELDHAKRWVQELDLTEWHDAPLDYERLQVAYARIFLATAQPTQALHRLEPALQRASAGQRWGHVMEIHLLQALAHQMCHEESQALDALSEAVRLGEPEGYIRSFVEEGLPMAELLSKLREKQRQLGPTPYLDRVLAAFPRQDRTLASQSKRAAGHTLVQPLLEPLSEREQQVLQLLAQGASNQEIAQQLVIAYDTVKRHVSHIFSKLGVQNRMRAIKRAQELGLLDKDL
jgi:LuxR family maltose regulon positive regulatory protein